MTACELLSEIVRSDLAPLDSASPLRDVRGWDSLKGVRLVLRIEETIGRQLSEEELENLLHVHDVERLLSSENSGTRG